MAGNPPGKTGPTQQEIALSDVSNAQWEDYKARFRPAEKALAKNAEMTKGERAQVKGQVSADTEQAFKGLMRSTIASGAASGAQASSGKTKLSIAADARAAGKAKGVGQSIAETGAEIDEQGRQLQIASFGRGVAQNVTANMSRGAVRATKLAIAASEAKFIRNAARMDAVASVAGAATRKFGGDLMDRDGPGIPYRPSTPIGPDGPINPNYRDPFAVPEPLFP